MSSLEEVDVLSVVVTELVTVVVGMVAVIVGTATLEITEAAERPASDRIDHTRIFKAFKAVSDVYRAFKEDRPIL